MEEIDIRCFCCKKCIGTIHIEKSDRKSKKTIKKLINQTLCESCLKYLITSEIRKGGNLFHIRY